MPNSVAISQATAKINRGRNPPPPQALSVSNRPGQIGLTSRPKDDEGELRGQASEVTHPEFDLTLSSLTSVA